MDNKIVLSIQNLLIQKHQTLACAESCTGGHLSHLLTSHSGSSKFFLGSFVTYANEVKEKILKVSPESLAVYGAVSKETVQEMIQGVFSITSADFAIAISGVAGPDGGTEKNPVGTVWIAVGARQGPLVVERFSFKGSRLEVISQSSIQSLLLLAPLLNR